MNNPEQALDEYMGEQFIEWLGSYISQEMHTWPVITKLATAKPKPEKVKKLAMQMFLVTEAFLGTREGDPGFLRFIIANLSESDDPQAESALEILEKRRTDELIGHRAENGIMQTIKREQWLRLLKVIGASEEEINRSEPKEPTRNYIAELSDILSTMDWQTAVGAFASMERSSAEMYKAFVQLLKNNSTATDKDLEVLTNQIHASAQVGSSHILDKVVFDREAKDFVWQGVTREMEIKKEFLEGLEKYLEN